MAPQDTYPEFIFYSMYNISFQRPEKRGPPRVVIGHRITLSLRFSVPSRVPTRWGRGRKTHHAGNRPQLMTRENKVCQPSL